MEKPNQRKSIILKTKNCSNREQFYILFLLVRLSEKNSVFRRFP